MFNKFNGRIIFEAIAPNVECFINSLIESCIIADNIQYENGKIIGKIDSSSYNELIKVGNSCAAQISIIGKSGLLFWALKYKKRLGFLIGAVIAIIIIFFLSDTVMIINVYGNETISDCTVLAMAKESGIYIGANISDMDLRNAERIMVSSSEDISWVGVRASGCTINIEIYEADDTPCVVEKNIPCNIVSEKDAQIIDIKNVYSGMLMQMLNSGVKKGEILISGTVEDGQGGVYYTHSTGDIIGRYSETMIFTQDYCDDIIEFDNKFTKKSIHFLGRKIPLYIKEKQIDNTELTETITYFNIFGIQLPMGMIYAEYQPYNIKKVEYDKNEAKILILNKIKQFESNFFENEEKIVVDKSIEYVENNNCLKAIVKYTIEGNIGVKKEIMVK